MNNLCVLTDTDEVNEKSDISVSESNKVKEEVEEEVKEEVKEELEENTQRVEQSKGQESRKEELELDEYNMDVDNLEETDLQLEELGIYEVYELINTKIKENIIQNIRNILINKKIKTKLDLAEMVDDEDEEE